MTPLRHILLAAATTVTAACGNCETPTMRGDDDAIAAFADIWDLFTETTPQHDTCVRSIAQAEQPEMGRYFPVGRRVTIAPDVAAGEELFVTVHHELCHALDVQNDVSTALAGRWAYEVPTDRNERREHFAETCEVGEAALDLMHQPECDPTEVTSTVDLLRSEVFRGFAYNPQAVLLWVASYQSDALATARLERAVGRADEVIELAWAGAGNHDALFVNGYTGEVVEQGGEPLTETTSDAARPHGLRMPRVLEWPDGSGDLLGRATLDIPAGTASRILVQFPDAFDDLWSPVYGCVSDDAIVFELDQGLWVADQDGDTLRWGRIVRWRDAEWQNLNPN